MQRNVTKLLNSNSKEDFLQSFQDMYNRSQWYMINGEKLTWAEFKYSLDLHCSCCQPQITKLKKIGQMNSLAASVKLTYSSSMVDRLTDFCLKVRHEIGVSSIKVMNPPIDTRSSLFVAKSESE
ncbi:hypothetical protein TNCV_255361 [Trichonephila clavipes]|nr:hypothetical protein TNCV_255361 [Trichonephila clavipes]